jgi:hypothetical protein
MKKIYSYNLVSKIEAKIPKSILQALGKEGWNALGIYELVKKEIKNSTK